MRVTMAGATNVGRRRKINQDSIFYDEPQGLGIVADGIGGRRGGEVASGMIIDGLRQRFLESSRIRHGEVPAFLAAAIDEINKEVLAAGAANQELNGLGSTVNCLLFLGNSLHLAHVGDSRTYLYYQRNLWQLTVDHNIRNALARGWLQAAAVAPGTRSEALTRAIGLHDRCEVDLQMVPLRRGEIFLTCSDGLTGMVEDQRISDIVAQHEANVDALPQALIEEANRNGGKDNITVLICQVQEV